MSFLLIFGLALTWLFFLGPSWPLNRTWADYQLLASASRYEIPGFLRLLGQVRLVNARLLAGLPPALMCGAPCLVIAFGLDDIADPGVVPAPGGAELRRFLVECLPVGGGLRGDAGLRELFPHEGLQVKLPVLLLPTAKGPPVAIELLRDARVHLRNVPVIGGQVSHCWVVV